MIASSQDRVAPAVSICIRAYRHPDRLREAIASVIAQSVRNFEVVVSDDSGGLEPIVRQFRDPRVRYHRNPRPSGPVANIRTVFGLARAPLIGLLDHDDRLLPGYLAQVLRRFADHPEAGVVFTDYYFEAGGYRVRRASQPLGDGVSLVRGLLRDCPIAPSAAVMRRAVWEQGERRLPLLDAAVGDLTMWLRAALAGWRFEHVDEPLVAYRITPDQLSWTDEGIPGRVVAALERFRFDDPVCEGLRRSRLAEARLASAHIHLRHGRFRDGLSEIGRASSEGRRWLGPRGLLALSGLRAPAVRWAARRPALVPSAIETWSRIRPGAVPIGPPLALARSQKRL